MFFVLFGFFIFGCRVSFKEFWFCRSKLVGIEVVEFREVCLVLFSVLMVEFRWNEIWSFFFGCRRGGRRVVSFFIRVGGRIGFW